jgi:hypothetical protein
MMMAGDLPLLFGFAVRDPIGLMNSVRSMLASGGGDPESGPTTSTTVHNGNTIMSIQGQSGPTVHVGTVAGFALFSTSQQVLFDAVDRVPTQSLAASASFQEVLRNAPAPAGAPLAVFYTDSPSMPMPRSAFGPNIPTDFTGWSGATLRFDSQGLRIDQTGALLPDKLTPSLRALAALPPNQFQAARLAPANSSVWFGIAHLDLIWRAIGELLANDPDSADMLGQSRVMFRAQTGLDLDRDVFGWMTGEHAGFLAPGGPEAPGGIGGGLLVQASDAATAQQRLAALIDALARDETSNVTIEAVTLGGATFSRLSSSNDPFALYLGAVGPWVVAAADATVATGIAQRAANATDLGLSGDPSFKALQTTVPGPAQGMMYLDVSALTELIISAAQPSAREAAQVRFYVAPFKRVIVNSMATPERSRGTTLIQIAVP